MADKLRVLFLCTANACRSQMAEGWTRQLKGDLIEAASAGVAPQALDPRAVAAMAEAGVDISGQRSKAVAELAGVEFDYVVTVCDDAREQCPVFPGRTHVVHVGFRDPARAEGSREEVEEVFRGVRDQIRGFVEGLPEILVEETR